MSWEKKPPIHGEIRGCAHNPIFDVAPMDMPVAVGFGDAHLEKDGKIIYREPFSGEYEFYTVRDAENEALKDPDHDWRIVLYAPLYGKCYQRQGKRHWVLIEENRGFA